MILIAFETDTRHRKFATEQKWLISSDSDNWLLRKIGGCSVDVSREADAPHGVKVTASSMMELIMTVMVTRPSLSTKNIVCSGAALATIFSVCDGDFRKSVTLVARRRTQRALNESVDYTSLGFEYTGLTSAAETG